MSGNERSESYAQDNLGNVNRELDDVRANEGMAGGDSDNNGIDQIPGGDTGTDVIVYSLPTHAEEVYVEEIHIYNTSGGPGNVQLYSATLDSNGNVDTTTRRSVPYHVADGDTETYGYSGDSFDQDAIVVNASVAVTVGVSVVVDHPESRETGLVQ